MSPTETTRGFAAASLRSRLHKRSDASAEPPGESMRRTTAFTDESPVSSAISLPSSRSVMPSLPPRSEGDELIAIDPMAGRIAT